MTAIGSRRNSAKNRDIGLKHAKVTMITNGRFNEVDPKAWLADILAPYPRAPPFALHELLPRECKLLGPSG